MHTMLMNNLARIHSADLQRLADDPAARLRRARKGGPTRAVSRLPPFPRLAVGRLVGWLRAVTHPRGRRLTARPRGPRTQHVQPSPGRSPPPDPAGAARMIDTMTGRLVSPTIVAERELATMTVHSTGSQSRAAPRSTCSSPVRPASGSPA